MRSSSSSLRILSALLLTTLTSALALPRTPASTLFNITNFHVSSSPHSTYTNYGLLVSSSSSATSASCSNYTSTGPYISDLTPSCCTTTPASNATDPCAWTFSFEYTNSTATGSGYLLKVGNELSDTTKEVATTFFPASDVAMYVDTDNPNGDFQYLNASASFVLAATAEA